MGEKNYFSEIDLMLEKYANKVPKGGMHLEYFIGASRLLDIYGEASAIMEEDETPENDERLKELYEEARAIVK